MRPEIEDSLPWLDGEPDGYHRRRTTEDGYPLMGSSPAERAESAERAARIIAQARRDHPFEGEGKYCEHWRVLTNRMTGAGRLMMRDQCGYPREMHPAAGDDPPAA